MEEAAPPSECHDERPYLLPEEPFLGPSFMTPTLGSTLCKIPNPAASCAFPTCVSVSSFDTLGLVARVMCDPSTAVGKTEPGTQHPEKNGRMSRRLAGSKGT